MEAVHVLEIIQEAACGKHFDMSLELNEDEAL
jgi:hypothetical protein